MCKVCRGAKVATGEKPVEVIVEPGYPDGFEIVEEHAWDERPDHLAGHIVFRIVTGPHETFTRDGNNLRMTLRISLLEALVGFERAVTHLDGHAVVIRRSEVTSHNDVMQVRAPVPPPLARAPRPQPPSPPPRSRSPRRSPTRACRSTTPRGASETSS